VIISLIANKKNKKLLWKIYVLANI
jgi:hypothetical protein